MVHQKFGIILAFCGLWYIQKIPNYVAFIIHGSLNNTTNMHILWFMVHWINTKYNHICNPWYIQKYAILIGFVIHGSLSKWPSLPFISIRYEFKKIAFSLFTLCINDIIYISPLILSISWYHWYSFIFDPMIILFDHFLATIYSNTNNIQ